MNEDRSVPCTACHYCTDGCPMNIPIAEIFSVKNRQNVYTGWDKGKNDYLIAAANKGKASKCVGCGQCKGACPQQLIIIQLLKDCAAVLE